MTFKTTRIIIIYVVKKGGNPMTDKIKKVGRPKGENSNTVKLTVRVSEQLNSKLEEYGKKNGLTKPETLRKAFENLTK
ncbi:hypothetical protein U751_03540 [Streptococcus pseudopneumoniae 22725]|nr:hypothetical protein U751_03540 [Streptococcus pseudopneumoniae 22725]